MASERSPELAPGEERAATVAEFIRTRGVTKCPTACVLPTQGSVPVADRKALEEHALRRAELRRARTAARAQQFWQITILPPVPR